MCLCALKKPNIPKYEHPHQTPNTITFIFGFKATYSLVLS